MITEEKLKGLIADVKRFQWAKENCDLSDEPMDAHDRLMDAFPDMTDTLEKLWTFSDGGN